jgi:hypothetical protein
MSRPATSDGVDGSPLSQGARLSGRTFRRNRRHERRFRLSAMAAFGTTADARNDYGGRAAEHAYNGLRPGDMRVRVDCASDRLLQS